MDEIVCKPTISKTLSQLREKGGVVWNRLCGGRGGGGEMEEIVW